MHLSKEQDFCPLGWSLSVPVRAAGVQNSGHVGRGCELGREAPTGGALLADGCLLPLRPPTWLFPDCPSGVLVAHRAAERAREADIDQGSLSDPPGSRWRVQSSGWAQRPQPGVRAAQGRGAIRACLSPGSGLSEHGDRAAGREQVSRNQRPCLPAHPAPASAATSRGQPAGMTPACLARPPSTQPSTHTWCTFLKASLSANCVPGAVPPGGTYLSGTLSKTGICAQKGRAGSPGSPP